MQKQNWYRWHCSHKSKDEHGNWSRGSLIWDLVADACLKDILQRNFQIRILSKSLDLGVRNREPLCGFHSKIPSDQATKIERKRPREYAPALRRWSRLDHAEGSKHKRFRCNMNTVFRELRIKGHDDTFCDNSIGQADTPLPAVDVHESYTGHG